MLLVNTTFLVEPELEREWTDWALAAYMPAAKAVGGRSAKLLRILSAQGSASEGLSFAVQVFVPDADAASRWLDCHQPALLGVASRRWQQRVLHFTTVMEEVERD